MRIVMPIAQFDLGHGGAEIQTHRLARSLVRRGHRVEILSTRPRGTPAADALEGVEVRRFFSFGNARGLWRVTPYTFTGQVAAYLVARRRSHDLVHAQQAFHPAWASVLARRLGGRPVVVTVHTAGDFGDVRQMREGMATLPVGSSHMLRAILAGADALVGVSTAVVEDVRAAAGGSRPVLRIPNGVDVPVVTPQARAAARERLGLSAHPPVALFVGRASPQKGVDILVEAWGTVVARGVPGRLVLLGEGLPEDPAVASARATLGDRLVVPGRVLDVSSYLLASDLFVLASRGEGMSLALMEAMAHELPCIVSDLPANRELVTDGVTGITVPVGDPRALAAALESALGGLERLRPLGHAAREKIRTTLSLESAVDRYEDLYRRLVSSAAPVEIADRG